MISNPIEIAVLGGASTVFSIAGNPRTTQPPDAEQKSQSFLSLPDKALAFSVVLKGMPTNHFPFCGYSFQNASGNPKGRQFLWPWVIQWGRGAPCWLGNPMGTAFPWQWFPKAAALPWREESKGGQRPSWQEESNETGGFVVHDLACKV